VIRERGPLRRAPFLFACIFNTRTVFLFNETHMSGILNSKQRFVDTVITAEGRRQLASGEFKVEFATFSDRDIFYGKDAVSGTIDQSAIIQLEAESGSPGDIITLETNLFGNVVAEIVAGVSSSLGDGAPISMIDGKIVQFNSASKNAITGSAYRDMTKSILNAGINNFKELSTISSIDPLLEDQDFKISQNEVTFRITAENVDDYCSLPVADISRDAESVHQDRHLSHLENYRYLPPRNKPTPTDPRGRILFDYANNSQADIITREDYENEVRFLPKAEIEFTNSSMENNVVAQLYETSGDQLTQLRAIDFGEFATGDSERPTKRVYFVGKLYPSTKDKFGNLTYVNMFTLEFD